MADTPMWRRYLRFAGPDVEADLDEELRFHLEMREEELVAAGVPPQQAREEARRRLGDLREIRDRCMAIDQSVQRTRRRRERTAMMHHDVRRAARGLARSPAFTAVAVLTLALGIGATTAIYAVLERVVLSPLPYPGSERLVWIESRVPGVAPDAAWGVSEAGFFHFRENGRVFEEIGAAPGAMAGAASVNLVTGRGAERVDAGVVSAGLLEVLGARPAAGRLLGEHDDAPGAPPAVMLGYDFWVREFGADPAVVGTTLELESRPVEVVGVMERGVQMPESAVDVWLPLQLDRSRPPVNAHWVAAVGRLREGVSLEQAQAELDRLTADFPRLFPSAYDDTFMRETGFHTRVVPLRERVVGDVGPVLWLLLGAVSVVLLIACGNVANLFLVRAEARRREVAIRGALGATRGDVARYYVSEGLLLSLVAGALGVGLAAAAIRALVALAPSGLPRLAEVGLGGSGVLFALLVSLAVGVVFGLFPVARGDGDFAVLREGGRGLSASRPRQRVRSGLVIAQVALALVLLSAAGLMLRTFQKLRAVQPGLDPSGVLTFDVSLPFARYGTYEEVSRFYRRLSERIGALPGVTSVGAAQKLPFKDVGGCSAVWIEDRPLPEGEEPPCLATPQVAPGFFAALGITVRGETPSWSDMERRSGGVVVTRAAAERLWPGEDPLGKGIRGYSPRGSYYRVVGVAGELRGEGLDRAPTEAVYFPMLPIEGGPLWSPPRGMRVVVKTALERPLGLVPQIRRELQAMDPEVPLADPQAMTAVVARSMSRTSFTMLLLAISGAMALLLSAVGLYGVISYLVGLRRNELGIRMALGAGIGQVRRMVLLQSVRLAAVGVALGLGGALLTTRALRSLLFEVSPVDPLTLGAVSAILLLLSMAASYLPAHRATRIDPAEVMRAE